jgi:ferredoxin/flavodoxin---NADP+ reductase
MPSTEDKYYRAAITKRINFAPDLWSIRLDPGAEFSFLPGQYATLGLQDTSRPVERAYSIASSPYENELEFFIELVPGGELTPLLYKLQVGDRILMRKVPKGRFFLETAGSRRNHLLVSTVTGLAPYLSIIRSLLKDSREGKFPEGHRLFLLHGASRSWEFGYHEELSTVASEVKWLTYVPTVSRPWEDEKWQQEKGRVDDLLRKYIDQWELKGENSLAYLCGHPGMIEHSKGILQRSGFPKGTVKEEIYWIPATKVPR